MTLGELRELIDTFSHLDDDEPIHTDEIHSEQFEMRLFMHDYLGHESLVAIVENKT